MAYESVPLTDHASSSSSSSSSYSGQRFEFQYVSEKQQSRILHHSSSNSKPSFLSRALTSCTPKRDDYPFSRMYASRGNGDVGRKVQRQPTPDSCKDYELGWYRGVALRVVRQPGNRPSKRLLALIVLNLAFSLAELLLGLLTRRTGLVSDAFHLSFGCGVLTFSLVAMAWADRPLDTAYTYGYKRLEVLAAFTNALFLLFLAFSLAVEALHVFVEDEENHKHYLIVSAVSNLAINLLGVWFFRSYARVHFAYRRAQDMNLHSVCLHVLSDSFRSGGVILSYWLLSLGFPYAETLCQSIVSITIFYTAVPIFKASGGILSQMAPCGTTAAALNKCLRQVRMLDDVVQCYKPRFWDLVPGYIVGTLSMKVSEGADEERILRSVHSIYNDIGVKDLTVEIEIYD